MKLNKFFLSLTLLLAPLAISWAQTGVETGTPFGSGEDSIKCRQNITLFIENAKAKNYADAYEFWKQALSECPGATKNIYIYGAQIMDYRIGQETDPAKKEALIDELMALYDQRAKYFGDDPNNGTDWIMAAKVSEYIRLKGQEVDFDKIYSWVKPSVDQYQKNTYAQAVYFFVFSSLNKAIGNKDWHEQYVNDYMLGNAILEESVEKYTTAGDTVQLQNTLNMKGQLDELFAQSGLADCQMLTSIYGSKLEANKGNVEFLQAMLDMFRYGGCDQDPMYFTASKYLYGIKPTAAAALGLAQEAIENKNNSEATKYLNDAIKLTNDNRLKGHCYYQLGVIAMKAGQYSQARTYCYNAVDANPSMGAALLLVAQMYASSAKSIFPGDPVKQRCVYYLAIDVASKARNIAKDAKVQAQASRLIGTYSSYLPSSQDIFFHPELNQGQSLYIGGWIGQSVTIR